MNQFRFKHDATLRTSQSLPSNLFVSCEIGHITKALRDSICALDILRASALVEKKHPKFPILHLKCSLVQHRPRVGARLSAAEKFLFKYNTFDASVALWMLLSWTTSSSLSERWSEWSTPLLPTHASLLSKVRRITKS